MVELKVRKFGNSLGVVLPERGNPPACSAGDGERLFLIEIGGRRLPPHPLRSGVREENERRPKRSWRRYRNTLRALAKLRESEKEGTTLDRRARCCSRSTTASWPLHGGRAGVARCRPSAVCSGASPPASRLCHRPWTSSTMAALYTAGIVRNHPFVDGNKRTGFVIGRSFP